MNNILTTLLIYRIVQPQILAKLSHLRIMVQRSAPAQWDAYVSTFTYIISAVYTLDDYIMTHQLGRSISKLCIGTRQLYMEYYTYTIGHYCLSLGNPVLGWLLLWLNTRHPNYSIYEAEYEHTYPLFVPESTYNKN
jgi:hypothetical protein